MPDYLALTRALNDVDAAADIATAAADADYAARAGVGAAEVARAELAVRDAEAALRAAERDVDAIDERSRLLWQELATLLGWRGRRIGGVPLPDSAPTSTEPARKHLDRAGATIGRSALGQQIAPIPRGIIPLLPPCGALAALLAVLVIRAVTALTGLIVIPGILLFLAPFSAVPPLIAWTAHRYGTKPDIGAIALTAVGGMIASCAMVALLR